MWLAAAPAELRVPYGCCLLIAGQLKEHSCRQHHRSRPHGNAALHPGVRQSAQVAAAGVQEQAAVMCPGIQP